MLRGRVYTFVFRSYLILLQPSLRVPRAETRLTVYRPLQVVGYAEGRNEAEG